MEVLDDHDFSYLLQQEARAWTTLLHHGRFKKPIHNMEYRQGRCCRDAKSCTWQVWQNRHGQHLMEDKTERRISRAMAIVEEILNRHGFWCVGMRQQYHLFRLVP